jgi:hypothetical protein
MHCTLKSEKYAGRGAHLHLATRLNALRYTSTPPYALTESSSHIEKDGTSHLKQRMLDSVEEKKSFGGTQYGQVRESSFQFAGGSSYTHTVTRIVWASLARQIYSARYFTLLYCQNYATVYIARSR